MEIILEVKQTLHICNNLNNSLYIFENTMQCINDIILMKTGPPEGIYIYIYIEFQN